MAFLKLGFLNLLLVLLGILVLSGLLMGSLQLCNFDEFSQLNRLLFRKFELGRLAHWFGVLIWLFCFLLMLFEVLLIGLLFLGVF